MTETGPSSVESVADTTASHDRSSLADDGIGHDRSSLADDGIGHDDAAASLDTVADALAALDADDLDRAEVLAASLDAADAAVEDGTGTHAD